jgi:hypothetical protein
MGIRQASDLAGNRLEPQASAPFCPACRERMRLTALKADPAHPYRLPVATFSCRCGRRTVLPWRPAGQRFAVMAGENDDIRSDYAVTIAPCNRSRGRWRWDIKRLSKPLGLIFYDDDFVSEPAARLAGEKALLVFLDGLVHELDAARA